MKCIVSLSGGRDSATCLGVAVERYGEENVRAIGFTYGSKHPQEIEAAKKIAAYYNVPYKVVAIDPSIFAGSTSTLLESSHRDVQLNKTYGESMQENGQKKVDTYVPARNTLFSAYTLAMAESLSQEYDEDVVIMLGQHADDCGFTLTPNGEEVLDASRAAYPDTSLEFVNAFAEVARISSVGRVHYEAPFVKMHKWQLIKTGLELKKRVPYRLCMSCYQPVETADGHWRECGKCATDLDVQAAYNKALEGIQQENPALYDEGKGECVLNTVF